MSNYVTISELTERIGADRLAALCHSSDAQAQQTLLGNVLDRAEAVVDGFASARYRTPLNPTGIIAEWTMRIAEYELYKRGPGSVLPEKIRESYRDAVAQLTELSAGRLQTGGQINERNESLSSVTVQVSPREDRFDARSMNVY